MNRIICEDNLAVITGDRIRNEPDGSLSRLIKKYKKVDLLIIDEWLLTTLPEEHTLTLFEIIESRLDTSSTIFYSQTALRNGMKNSVKFSSVDVK